MSALRWIGLGLLLAAMSGCSLVPQGKLTACESRNRILSEQTEAQQAEIVNLKEHARHIEEQLLAAQEQLAAFERRHAVDKARLANYQREREKLEGLLLGRLPEEASGTIRR